MVKIILCVCLLLGFGGSSRAQQKTDGNKKAVKYYQQALEAFRAGNTETSLKLAEKAKEIDAYFVLPYLLQADIFHKEKNKEAEIQAIEQAVRLDSLKGHGYYYFVLAEGYFDRGEYRVARQYYHLYLQKDKRLRAKEQARKRVMDCDFALHALQTQVRKETEHVFVSEQDVYWPALDITGNVLLYTEQRNEEERLWVRQDGKNRPLEWPQGERIGAASLTADGKMMYFTMIGNGQNRIHGSDIYVAYLLPDGSWSDPIGLGEPVNTEAWEAQPSISADGTKLYFASTRPGGQGGSDIWFSRLLKREANGRQYWSQPLCLYFNTPGNEMAPFLYYDNKTLFFSSDGYPGMGRKDVYKVDVEETSVPANIGITVNSYRDELGFVVDASGQWGYFASDVQGKKGIYRYRLEDSMACEPIHYLRFRILGENEEEIVPDRLTLVIAETGDTLACYNGRYTSADLIACIPAGRLLLLSVVKKGYMYYSDTLQFTSEEIGNNKTEEIRLRQIQPGRSLVLKGVFFDVDDYRLKPESYNELKQVVEFLRSNPEVKIEIAGHTDDSGSDDHNYRLSENRAFEVYKYLFLNRVKKDRMSYKGYGKDQPLAPNTTEKGKAVNRRTEIRIK